jgi:hypothetical protein
MSQCILARFQLPAQTFTAGATPLATTAGFYFLMGHSGEAVDQLCEHLADLIDATYAGADVYLDLSTGKITIDLGETGSITWGSTALRDLLGFDAHLSGASSYTAPNVARYLWRSPRDPSDQPNGLTLDTFWNPESRTRGVRSSDGSVRIVQGAYTAKRALLRWDGVSKALARRTEDPDPGTFEQLWHDAIDRGEQLRIVFDASSTSYTSSAYADALAFDPDEGTVGVFDNWCDNGARKHTLLWDIQIPLVELPS